MRILTFAVGVVAVSLLGGLAFTVARTPLPERDVAGLLKLTPNFDDEFDGSVLKGHWRTDFRERADARTTLVKRTLPGNRERQVYVDPAYLKLGIQPDTLANGVLTITAQPLTPAQRGAIMAELGTLSVPQRGSALGQVAYSSGMISTRGSVAQRFGFFETRARWTQGKGLWPAFWLLPEKGWPPELDIMEAHGDKPQIVFQSKHSGVEPAVTKRVPVPGGTSMWHRYGLLWTPMTLRFYIDGQETSRQAPPPDATGPMYMLANLAVGGSWPGDPDAGTRFPATMQLDWVRSYALPADWTEQRLDALN